MFVSHLVFMGGRSQRGHCGAERGRLFFMLRVHGKGSSETVNMAWYTAAGPCPIFRGGELFNGHEGNIFAPGLRFSCFRPCLFFWLGFVKPFEMPRDKPSMFCHYLERACLNHISHVRFKCSRFALEKPLHFSQLRSKTQLQSPPRSLDQLMGEVFTGVATVELCKHKNNPI